MNNSSSSFNFSALPSSEIVDVSALSRLFADTTNSYKYLFFFFLIDILKRNDFDINLSISFQQIVVEMIANAWYPHNYFKLSFGTQDKLTEKLDSLNLELSEPVLKFTDTDKKLLRNTIEKQSLDDIVKFLTRYVPYRLLCPFLEQELKIENVDRGKGNKLDIAMPLIARKYFKDRRPLYCFNSVQYNQCNVLQINSDWAKYLKDNYAIVRGWASWEWLNYMQNKNPNIPNLVNKIFIPQRRGALQQQTQYWKTVLQKQSKTLCIYSGEELDIKNISLDHYIPWSFVAHDQLWNLIPVRKEINSSKSNNLPSDQYFEKFVHLQYIGLTTYYQEFSRRKFLNQVDSYLNDLNIDLDGLLDYQKLRNAYQITMQPLINLAEKQGFSTNWTY
ncbi:HNH endonuclease domain-containing protein [Spirulina sp. CS-785/01]|uniref:HNH endonuclease domain-containing protein n=1 Tax=Spirulina sp. CS-785/01 TaxID=3021716 RepID=UPI0023314E8E|nr:HNH endonuclease domain-containing protein [Spirulina sp. CS-785/01]MDB9314133.1 HNH endonuclease domain-containing protein [Spirulina sp. CS-785/01]